MQKYYVIHTKPKQENKALINLKRQGFKTWFPFFKKTIFLKNREIEKKEPFFPGYIFVILDILKDDWSKIQSTFGVKYLITIDGIPKEIEHSNIKMIKQIIAGATLKLNDKVKIISGKLINKKGKIIEMCSSNRVKLLLESLNGKFITILNKKLLYKV